MTLVFATIKLGLDAQQVAYGSLDSWAVWAVVLVWALGAVVCWGAVGEKLG